MPLYEYVCEKCGMSEEVIQAFSDPLLTVCERCGGKLRKEISSPAVQFKGSGWYATDYKKSDIGSRTASESGSAEKKGEGEKKPASESESKPAASDSKDSAKSAKAD